MIRLTYVVPGVVLRSLQFSSVLCVSFEDSTSEGFEDGGDVNW